MDYYSVPDNQVFKFGKKGFEMTTKGVTAPKRKPEIRWGIYNKHAKRLSWFGVWGETKLYTHKRIAVEKIRNCWMKIAPTNFKVVKVYLVIKENERK